MAQDYASSIAGVAIRVTALDTTGAILSTAYVMESFISVSFTPEYEEGDEFVQKDANGNVCVSYKAPDTLKRVTLELAICNPDPEFTALTSGGVILTAAGGGEDSVGYAAPQIGTNATPNGTALEVWSRAIKNGKNTPTNPYWHWVFPYVILRPSGSRVIENGLLANTFEGWGVGNENFDAGHGDWLFPDTTDRPYMYARSATAPSGNGYVGAAGVVSPGV